MKNQTFLISSLLAIFPATQAYNFTPPDSSQTRSTFSTNIKVIDQCSPQPVAKTTLINYVNTPSATIWKQYNYHQSCGTVDGSLPLIVCQSELNMEPEGRCVKGLKPTVTVDQYLSGEYAMVCTLKSQVGETSCANKLVWTVSPFLEFVGPKVCDYSWGRWDQDVLGVTNVQATPGPATPPKTDNARPRARYVGLPVMPEGAPLKPDY